jgi:hypothetical protein
MRVSEVLGFSASNLAPAFRVCVVWVFFPATGRAATVSVLTPRPAGDGSRMAG